MKFCLITITIFILSINVFAQNWQTFNSKVNYVFDNSFVVYDSVKVHGADTLLYNFKNIRKVRDAVAPNDYAYSAVGPTVFGSVFVIKPNGVNVFLNAENDSVYINTKARLGDTLEIYKNILKNIVVLGRVDSVVLGKVLGVTDSLKYITLFTNATLGYGTTTSNITSLILSKNFGFVQTMSFFNVGYLFIDRKSFYNKNILLGHSLIPNSAKNLLVADIYDFNIGDELHIHQYNNGYFEQLAGSDFDLKRIEKVLSRNLSDNKDTLIYTIDVCQVKLKITTNALISSIKEVQTVKYLVNDTTNYLNSVPGKVYLTGGFDDYSTIIKSTQNGNIKSLGNNNDYYTCYMPDSCAALLVDGQFYSENYYKGFGGPYYQSFATASTKYRELVYSKKGTVVTGTPYDCDVILSVNEDKLANATVKLYPNPVKDKLTIELKLKSFVSIKNIIGVEVYKEQLDVGENDINISQLSSGIYFVVISAGDTIYTEKIVVE